jgi:hypothetical protein
MQGNEESMIQARRIDQQKSDRVPQRNLVPGYGRKRKHFSSEYKQHGVANNSQEAQLISIVKREKFGDHM